MNVPHRSCAPTRLLAIAALLLAHAAHAAPPELDVDLPAAPLHSMLIEIAKRAGVIVSFDPALVEGRVAPAVRGRLTVLQALRQALHDSGLVAEVSASGAITVAPAPATASPAEDALPRVVANPLPPVIVTASALPADDGLRPVTASSATRSPTPLSRLPQAVSVVSSESMALQQAATTTDALQHVTGTVAQYSSTAFDMMPTVTVRGLPALYSISGMRTLRESIPLDTAVVERLEVLKGPSSVTGGAAAMGGRGGTVDVQLKQAGPDHRTQAAAGVSSLDSGTLNASVDVGGALAESTHWRLITHGRRTGTTDGGYRPRQAHGLLGSLRHQDGRLQMGLTLHLDRRRDVPPPASRLYTDEETGTPIALAPGIQPPVSDDDRALTQADSLTFDAAWALTERWTARLRTRYETLDEDLRRHIYSPSGGTSAWTVYAPERRSSTLAAAQAELSGAVRLGDASHRLLLAFDTHRWRTKLDMGFAFWSLDTTEFEPGRTPLPDTADFGDAQAMFRASPGQGRRNGVLLQDVMSWKDLTLRLAVRRDWGRERLSDEARLDPRPTLSWDTGMAYQATPTVTVYAGAQAAREQAYARVDEHLYDGRPIPAPSIRQVQAGLKMDLLDDELALTIEAYRLRQSNVTAQSAELPGDGYFVQPGRESRGVEVELSGRLTARLEAGLGLAFVRSRDTETAFFRPATDVVRGPANGVPSRSLSLVARYRLPESIADASSLGLSVRAFSSMWLVSPHTEGLLSTMRLPGGARVDMSWTRQLGAFQLTASVQNLFDRTLYGVHSQIGFVPVGPGRSFGLALNWRQ